MSYLFVLHNIVPTWGRMFSQHSWELAIGQQLADQLELLPNHQHLVDEFERTIVPQWNDSAPNQGQVTADYQYSRQCIKIL